MYTTGFCLNPMHLGTTLEGKGEYFRDTILDALLFEGETILEY